MTPLFRHLFETNCTQTVACRFKKRKAIVDYRKIVVNFAIKRLLERTSDGKSKSVTLTRKEDARQLLGIAEFCVRVVKVDQTERDVDDRHLHAEFSSDARLKIFQFRKRTVAYLEQRILLHIAA